MSTAEDRVPHEHVTERDREGPDLVLLSWTVEADAEAPALDGPAPPSSVADDRGSRPA